MCEISFDEQGKEIGRVNYTYDDNGLLTETCFISTQDSSYVKREYVYEGNTVKCYLADKKEEGRRLLSERTYRDCEYKVLECEVEYGKHNITTTVHHYYDARGRILRRVKHIETDRSEADSTYIFIYDYKKITVLTSDIVVEDFTVGFPVTSTTVIEYRDEEYKYIARQEVRKQDIWDSSINVAEYGYDGCGRLAYIGMSTHYPYYDRIILAKTQEWQYVYSGKKRYGSFVYRHLDPYDYVEPGRRTIKTSSLTVYI